VELSRDIAFTFELALDRALATEFVRDVAVSLSAASFLEDVRVVEGTPSTVSAAIPINAALLGQRRLTFESAFEPTPRGAVLRGRDLTDRPLGYAVVSGEARVAALPGGSRVDYRFVITVHLDLPEPEKWGGRALMKMVEYTADRMLERIASQFPEAIERSAKAFEAAIA
jgi:hypothetical protein